MLRTLKRPGDWGDYKHVVPMELGGTGEETPAAGLATLNGIPANMVGKPNGPIPRRGDNTVDPKYLGDLITGMAGIDGDLTILPNQTKEYFITTYDSFLEYNIVPVNGTIVVDRNVIYYTARSLPGIGGFTINGRRISIVISGIAVMPPTIESPVTGAVDRPQSLYITASAFEAVGASDTHLKSDWQLATDAAFTNIVKSNTGTTASLTMWGVSGLGENIKFYARVRYYGTTIGVSQWSPTVSFTTRVGVGVAPEIIRPVAGTLLTENATFSKSNYVADIGTVQIPMVYDPGTQGDANRAQYGAFTNAQYSTSHVSTDWQISKTSDFAVLAFQGTTDANVIDWLAQGLSPNTTYYIRARNRSLKRTPQYAQMTPDNVIYQEENLTEAWGYASIYQTKSSDIVYDASILNFNPDVDLYPKILAAMGGSIQTPAAITIQVNSGVTLVSSANGRPCFPLTSAYAGVTFTFNNYGTILGRGGNGGGGNNIGIQSGGAAIHALSGVNIAINNRGIIAGGGGGGAGGRNSGNGGSGGGGGAPYGLGGPGRNTYTSGRDATLTDPGLGGPRDNNDPGASGGPWGTAGGQTNLAGAAGGYAVFHQEPSRVTYLYRGDLRGYTA